MPQIQPPSPEYVGPAKWHGAANNKPINRVVIHSTVGAEPGVKGAARSTVAGSKQTSRPSSYHYVADATESLQYVYDSVVAYGAPPNEHSLHYELCCSLSAEGKGHWERPDHQAMLKIAAADVAQMCLAYDVPIVKLSSADLLAGKRGICGHIDVTNAWHETTHWDPGPYFLWPQFMGMVQAAAKAFTDKPTPTPHPTPQPAPQPGPKVDADFYVAEISGLWDADDAVWAEAIDIAIKAGATVIGLTETTIDGRMKRVCPTGWDFARLDGRYGESECTVMWKKSARKEASPAYPTVLADTQFYTGKGHLRPQVTSVTACLEDDHGNVDLFTVCHTPNGDTAAREKAHQETLDAIPDAWDKGIKLNPGAGRIFLFDLNRDMRRAEVRQAWAETFPKLTLCWSAVGLPDHGTLGDAVYDGVAAGEGRLQIVSAHVLPRASVPGKGRFDHRSVLVGIARVKS